MFVGARAPIDELSPPAVGEIVRRACECELAGHLTSPNADPMSPCCMACMAAPARPDTSSLV